jgi:hypothetical protein
MHAQPVSDYRYAFRCIPLVAGLFLMQPGACPAASIDWTNTSGRDWNVAANWSPNQVPDPSDTASVTNSKFLLPQHILEMGAGAGS